MEDRDAALLKILREQDARLAAGEGDEENVFLSQAALYSFRRDSALGLAEKIKHQELLVSAHDKRDARWKSRRATGIATDLDLLEKTEDLLRAKVLLAELKKQQ